MKAVCLTEGCFRHFADSALHRNHHPLFITDDAESWSALICPAIRISRLGTHISARFASRYYSGIVPAAIILPEDMVSSLADAPERYFIGDSAFCIGDSAVKSEGSECYRLSCGDSDLSVSAKSIGADEAVSRVSAISTLRMGDFLIFADQRIVVPLTLGQRLTVDLNGIESISLAVR